MGLRSFIQKHGSKIGAAAGVLLAPFTAGASLAATAGSLAAGAATGAAIGGLASSLVGGGKGGRTDIPEVIPGQFQPSEIRVGGEVVGSTRFDPETGRIVTDIFQTETQKGLSKRLDDLSLRLVEELSVMPAEDIARAEKFGTEAFEREAGLLKPFLAEQESNLVARLAQAGIFGATTGQEQLSKERERATGAVGRLASQSRLIGEQLRAQRQAERQSILTTAQGIRGAETGRQLSLAGVPVGQSAQERQQRLQEQQVAAQLNVARAQQQAEAEAQKTNLLTMGLLYGPQLFSSIFPSAGGATPSANLPAAAAGGSQLGANILDPATSGQFTQPFSLRQRRRQPASTGLFDPFFNTSGSIYG